MQRFLSVLLAGFMGCGVLLSSAAPARADIQIGGDLETAVPIDSRAQTGGGFAIRLGYQLHIPLLVITPEAVFNYAGFSGTYGPEIFRGLAGLRLGIGEVFRLGAFTHAGLARLSADVPGPDPSRTGFSYDIGLFFAFTLLPLLNIGVHMAYNRMPDEDAAFQWLTFGAHAELII